MGMRRVVLGLGCKSRDRDYFRGTKQSTPRTAKLEINSSEWNLAEAYLEVRSEVLTKQSVSGLELT